MVLYNQLLYNQLHVHEAISQILFASTFRFGGPGAKPQNYRFVAKEIYRNVAKYTPI
jgi:hypothetical protein